MPTSHLQLCSSTAFAVKQCRKCGQTKPVGVLPPRPQPTGRTHTECVDGIMRRRNLPHHRGGHFPKVLEFSSWPKTDYGASRFNLAACSTAPLEIGRN